MIAPIPIAPKIPRKIKSVVDPKAVIPVIIHRATNKEEPEVIPKTSGPAKVF